MRPRRLIGKGLTAEVFEWSDSCTCKLFHPSRSRAKVELEFTVSRSVHAAGALSPRVDSVIELDGRFGIVMERVDGVSMFQHFQARPWTLFRGAKKLAEMHAQVHALAAPPELPSLEEQIRKWIADAEDLPPCDRAEAVRILSRMGCSSTLCHGDFHPGNILLGPRGPVIIDWSRANAGDPIADVARTCHLIETADLPPETPVSIRLLVNLSRRLLLRFYLRRYFQLRPGSPVTVREWRPVQLAAASAWRANQWA